jgi:hypothetical protein
VAEFADQFLSKVYIQGLLQGNLILDKVRGVDNMRRTKLWYSSLPADTVTDIRWNGLTDGAWTVKVDSLDRSDAITLVSMLHFLYCVREK